MDNSVFRITLDIHRQTTQVNLAVKKGDTARRIIATLVDGGKPYIIGDGCSAVFMAEKPEGNVLYNACTIENGQIIYDFTEQTVSVVGRMPCELRLYGSDEKIITSPRIAIIVSGTVYDDAQVESTSEFTALSKAMTELEELKEKKLPATFTVTYTGNEDEYHRIDKTFAEIRSAIDAGKVVQCLAYGSIIPLAQDNGNALVFIRTDAALVTTVVVSDDGTAQDTYSESLRHTRYFHLCYFGDDDGWHADDFWNRDLSEYFGGDALITPTCILHDMGPDSDGATEIHLPLESVNHNAYTFIFQGTVAGKCYTAKLTIEDINDEWGVPAAEVTVEDVDSGSYTLPVATPETLGGVKPVTKTASMTQPVGVGSDGRLYTESSGEGGGNASSVDLSNYYTKSETDTAIADAIADIEISGGEDGSQAGNANIFTYSVTAEQEVNGFTVELPVELEKFYIIDFRISTDTGIATALALYSQQTNTNYKSYGQIVAGAKVLNLFGVRGGNEEIFFNLTQSNQRAAKAPPALRHEEFAALPAVQRKSFTLYSNTSGANFPAGSIFEVWGVYKQ